MSKIITQKCKVENCGNQGRLNKRRGRHYLTRGYCGMHYARLSRHGNPNYVRQHNTPKWCKIDGCNSIGMLRRGKRYYPLGYCIKHYGRFNKYGDTKIVKRVKSGMPNHPLRGIYDAMKTRCYNPNCKSYKNYGGRGITVCDRWLGVYGFTNFITDMGDKPSDKHSIDRIDNNKGYSPENCRWATRHQQAANTSCNNSTVGVSYDKQRNKWVAKLVMNGEHVMNARFESYKQAKQARLTAEDIYKIKHEQNSSNGWRNFIDDGYI